MSGCTLKPLHACAFGHFVAKSDAPLGASGVELFGRYRPESGSNQGGPLGACRAWPIGPGWGNSSRGASQTASPPPGPPPSSQTAPGAAPPQVLDKSPPTPLRAWTALRVRTCPHPPPRCSSSLQQPGLAPTRAVSGREGRELRARLNPSHLARVACPACPVGRVGRVGPELAGVASSEARSQVRPAPPRSRPACAWLSVVLRRVSALAPWPVSAGPRT
jgi:hypothetical protein